MTSKEKDKIKFRFGDKVRHKKYGNVVFHSQGTEWLWIDLSNIATIMIRNSNGWGIDRTVQIKELKKGWKK